MPRSRRPNAGGGRHNVVRKAFVPKHKPKEAQQQRQQQGNADAPLEDEKLQFEPQIKKGVLKSAMNIQLTAEQHASIISTLESHDAAQHKQQQQQQQLIQSNNNGEAEITLSTPLDIAPVVFDLLEDSSSGEDNEGGGGDAHEDSEGENTEEEDNEKKGDDDDPSQQAFVKYSEMVWEKVETELSALKFPERYIEQSREKILQKQSVINMLQQASSSSSSSSFSIRECGMDVLAQAMDWLVIHVPEHSMPDNLQDKSSQGKNRANVVVLRSSSSSSSSSLATDTAAPDTSQQRAMLNASQLTKVQFLMQFGFNYGQCEQASVECNHDVLKCLTLLLSRIGCQMKRKEEKTQPKKEKRALSEEEEEERQEAWEMELVALEAILEEDFSHVSDTGVLDVSLMKMRFQAFSRYELNVVFPRAALLDCDYPDAICPPFALLTLIRSEEERRMQAGQSEADMEELTALNLCLQGKLAGLVTGDPFVHAIYEVVNEEILPAHEKKRMEAVRIARRAQREAEKRAKRDAKGKKHDSSGNNNGSTDSGGKPTTAKPTSTKHKLGLTAGARALVERRRQKEEEDVANEQRERASRWARLEELKHNPSSSSVVVVGSSDNPSEEQEQDNKEEEEEMLKRQVHVAETEQQKILRETRLIIQERMHQAMQTVQQKYPILSPEERKQRNAYLKTSDFKRMQSKKCKEMTKRRTTLPAHGMRSQVLDVIEQNRVLVVSGETGCGKSTQVPQFILERFVAEKGMGSCCNVIVTQPRRLAAIALAERVSEERNQKCGTQVGYSIRLESQFSSATQLLFCTTGILLRRLESDPTLEHSSCGIPVSHVIVDEVHERSLNSDFLLIILKELLRKRQDLTVILMSATVNASLFIDYFKQFNCAHINIPGRTFPVDSFYLDYVVQTTGYELDGKSPYATREYKAKQKGNNKTKKKKKGDQKLTRQQTRQQAIMSSWQEEEERKLDDIVCFIKDERGEDLGITQQTMDTILGMDVDQINYDLLAELVVHLIASGKHSTGAMLIFVSGSAEIDKTIQSIEKLFSEKKSAVKFQVKYTLPQQKECDTEQFERKPPQQINHALASKSLLLLPLHSSLDSSQQRKVFMHPRNDNIIKIVVSTNIAETSLTIDDCTCVIDTGKHKEMSYDPSRFMSVLAETWVSCANASQRSGRAGRVMPGKCYRLYTQQRFKHTFKPQPTPEMLSVPLESIVLKIKVLQLGDARQFLNRAIEPPSQDNIDHVLSSLQELQAIYKDEQQEELTSLGYHLANLPVDPKVGKMMIYSCLLCCTDPILTIAAALQCQSPFYAPKTIRDQVDKKRKQIATQGNTQSDHITTLLAYNGYYHAKENHNHKSYAQQNFLSPSTLLKITSIKRQFAEVLSELGFIRRGVTTRRMVKLSLDGVRDASGLDVNVHSDNIQLIEAVILAGLYPNVAFVKPPRNNSNLPTTSDSSSLYVFTKPDGEVAIHPSSVLFDLQLSDYVHSQCLVYHNKVKTSKIYLRDATVVPPLSLLLFGKDLDIIYSEGYVLVDKWIRLKADVKTSVLIKELRVRLQAMLRQKITEMTMTDSNSNNNDPDGEEQHEVVVSESHLATVNVLSLLFVPPAVAEQEENTKKATHT